MFALPGILGTVTDLLMVVLGFGFIVFIHEAGHFVAARWAGIRVLTFALGFGPAAASFRKGLGLRRGSSEREYESLRRRSPSLVAGVSPTEYRLNWLPFGGYVRMLGQEDLNPDAVSAEPDSYQRCKPWKRMVVISAGVVCNVVLAGVLFVIVFMAGLTTEPARIGGVEPGSAAAEAVAVNAAELGVTTPGLQPGDVLDAINDIRPDAGNGHKPNTFNDLILETAMSRAGEPVRLVVSRQGTPGDRQLRFDISPKPDEISGMLELGVSPSVSGQVRAIRPEDDKQRRRFLDGLDKIGFAGVQPGMRLVEVNGVGGVGGGVGGGASGDDLVKALRDSGGEAVRAKFALPGATPVEVRVEPRAQLQTARIARKDRVVVVEHLLGLLPVMTVGDASPDRGPRAFDQGLRDGDVFARIGGVEFPSVLDGIAEIRASAGKSIVIDVLRRTAGASAGGSGDGWEEVHLPSVRVSSGGSVGFSVGETTDTQTLLARPLATAVAMPQSKTDPGDAKSAAGVTPTSASAVFTVPGTRIVSIAGTPVANFTDIRGALQRSTRDALGGASASVPIVVRVPSAAVREGEERTLVWTIPQAELRALHGLGWRAAFNPGFVFEPRQVVLKASGPAAAVMMGVAETRRVMLTTYATFLRLFQGTVKVEQLKGPVGIAHIGTLLADRGFVWLLFFMAMISVNLAVINFLPLPIVDGGQFCFLVYEQFRGKPVSIAVQNVATIAGMVLIGSVFLIVTYHDIRNLFSF